MPCGGVNKVDVVPLAFSHLAQRQLEREKGSGRPALSAAAATWELRVCSSVQAERSSYLSPIMQEI